MLLIHIQVSKICVYSNKNKTKPIATRFFIHCSFLQFCLNQFKFNKVNCSRIRLEAAMVTLDGNRFVFCFRIKTVYQICAGKSGTTRETFELFLNKYLGAIRWRTEMSIFRRSFGVSHFWCAKLRCNRSFPFIRMESIWQHEMSKAVNRVTFCVCMVHVKFSS